MNKNIFSVTPKKLFTINIVCLIIVVLIEILFFIDSRIVSGDRSAFASVIVLRLLPLLNLIFTLVVSVSGLYRKQGRAVWWILLIMFSFLAAVRYIF